MNDFSIPLINSLSSKSDQRKHKHWRKKNVRDNKRKTFVHGTSVVYLPLKSDDSDDEIYLNDLSYLRNRQNHSSTKSFTSNTARTRCHSFSDPFLHCDFITVELQKNDTLRKISVKYGCSISDIKRANNIISDQEFFGLRKLKIPVKKYSLFTEDTMQNKSVDNLETLHMEGSELKNTNKTVSVGIGPMLSGNSAEEAAAFLKRMDEDLMHIMLNTKSEKGSLEEVTAALSESRFHPLVKDAYTNVDSVQWSYLLIFIIIIAIVIPICVILYIYLRPSNQTHNHELSHEGPSLMNFHSMPKAGS